MRNGKKGRKTVCLGKFQFGILKQGLDFDMLEESQLSMTHQLDALESYGYEFYRPEYEESDDVIVQRSSSQDSEKNRTADFLKWLKCLNHKMSAVRHLMMN